MKYLKLFESFNKFSFDDLDEMEIENYLLEFIDENDLRFYNYKKSDDYRFPTNIRVDNRIFDLYGDKYTQKPVSLSTFLNKPCITFMIDIPHPNRIRGNLYLEGFTRDMINGYLKKIHRFYDVRIYYQILETNWLSEDWMSRTMIFIIPNNPINESVQNDSTLLIVDVQKSFKKWFNENYVNALKKYASQFGNVYQIWDNHHHGKNVDKDYLYDDDPEIPVDGDLYTFPNQRDLIEKRYNYDVDVDFYKKILDEKTYEKIKNTKLKKGDYFHTTEGTIIVYIGNNHQWHHVPKKLYELFTKLRGKEVVIVGGSSEECLLDIMTAGKSLGVIVKPNYKYIYSATHCPIK